LASGRAPRKENVMAKRTPSDKWVRRVWQETNDIAAVARRISYSYVGAARRLYKLGLVSTSTSRSK